MELAKFRDPLYYGCMRRHLAFRVTMNSVAMIFIVYFLLQVFSYLRDNIIIGTADLTMLMPSIMGFMLGSVIPPLVVFGLMIYVVALPIQRVGRRLEAGEVLEPALLEKTRVRMLRFSGVVMGVNLFGFGVGYVLNLLASGQLSQAFQPDRLIVLSSNFAAGYCYATAQTSLNNVVFAPIRERLGIHDIGERTRETGSSRRQLYLAMALVYYAVSFVQFNVNDVMNVNDFQIQALAEVQAGALDAAGAEEHYRTLLREGLSTFSARTSLTDGDITIPWTRDINSTSLEEQVYFLMSGFIFVMALGVQVAYSVTLRQKVATLLQRLRDVVAGGGDLKVRISLTSTDDLGELSALVNKMLDQFQQVAQSIDASASQTREGAEAIDRVIKRAEDVSVRTRVLIEHFQSELAAQTERSHRISGLLDDLRQAARAAEQAAETQHALLDQTSEAMEVMAKGVVEVETKTTEAETVSAALAEKGRVGGQAVAETSAAISEIEATARQVLGVLSSLNKIAASTNLLAMNAAIEAAHAGSQGIGFAVVADEVRKLAQTAGQQTMQIKSLIATMSDRVGVGVKRAEATGYVIDELVVGLQQAAGISRSIADIMGRQTGESRRVSGSLAQVVQGSDAIKGRMMDQSTATRRMEEGLGQVLSSLETLTGESARQTEQARELDDTFRQVRAEVERNLASVALLTAEMQRFTF